MYPEDRTIDETPVPRRVGPFQLLTQVPSEPGIQLWTGIHRSDGGLALPALVALARSRSVAGQALLREAGHPFVDPNLMTPLALYEEGESLALGFVRPLGLSLAEILQVCARQYQRIPIHCGVFIAKEVLHGMGALHRRGVVHGTVDPRLVWIAFSGQVQLRGLGYGPAPDAIQYVPPFPLMPGYDAPEHATDVRPNPRSDVYRAASLLVHMLTGQSPPVAPVSLDRVMPEASPRLVHAVRRAMERDPRQRLDAWSFCDELARLLYSEDPTFGRPALTRFLASLPGLDPDEQAHRERVLSSEPDLGSFGPLAQRPPLEPTPEPPIQPQDLVAHRSTMDMQPPPPAEERISPLGVSAPSEEFETRLRSGVAGSEASPEPQSFTFPPTAPTQIDPPSEVFHPGTGSMPPTRSRATLVSLIVAALVIVTALLGYQSSRWFRQQLRYAVIGKAPGAILVLESVPPGAEVNLNGSRTGRRTPVTIDNIESGVVHDIELELAGQPSLTATVSLDAGASRTVTLTFPGAVVKTRITSDPTEAVVSLNGRRANFTPTELLLRVGESATLKVEKTGYLDWEKKVMPEPNTPLSFDVRLEKDPALWSSEDDAAEE
ncbi:MAG: PEGA domain-containing protein [Myxococcota bacterium]